MLFLSAVIISVSVSEYCRPIGWCSVAEQRYAVVTRGMSLFVSKSLSALLENSCSPLCNTDAQKDITYGTHYLCHTSDG